MGLPSVHADSAMRTTSRSAFVVDHIYIDAMFIGMMFTELHMMYQALASGAAPLRLPKPGSYLDGCSRQHETLVGSHSGVAAGACVARIPGEQRGATLPHCRLELGDPAPTDLMSTTLLDERQTAAFESACVAVGFPVQRRRLCLRRTSRL